MARARPSARAADAETDAFLDRMARVTAAEGFPPIGGRIFGLLLLSEEPLSLDAIAARLSASKGSISSDARRLEQRGLLERVCRAGDRRDYYGVAEDLFAATMRMRLARWGAFHAAMSSGRRCFRGRRMLTRRFEELDAAHETLSTALTGALERWLKRRAPAAPVRRTAARAKATATAVLLAVGIAAAPLPAQQPAAVPAAPLALTLGDAARLAARQSAPADQARWRAEAAEERVRIARADLLPHVEAAVFDGQRTYNSASFGITLPGYDPTGEIIGPVRSPDVRVGGSLTLLDLAARGRVRSAGAGADAARQDADAVAQDAAARAAAGYIILLRADALVEARTADSSLAWDLLDIARKNAAAGVNVALDVTRAEAQLAEARSDLIVARRDRDLARLILLRRLSLPLDATVRLTDPMDDPRLVERTPPPDSAVAVALGVRPDIRAAEELSRAARTRVSAIHAEALPTIALFGDAGRTGPEWSHLLSTYSYGVRVSVPIFDGLRRSARADETEALAREADARARDAREQTEAEVRGAILDVNAGREQVAAARERLRLAELEYAQARERFRTGVAGNADVVQASQSLNRARTRLVDALANLQTARVALARAQGAVTTLP